MTITLELPGRLMSLKNSRRYLKAKSKMGRPYFRNAHNEKAKAWLEKARWELKQQWHAQGFKEPSADAWRLTLKVYYENGRWWLDLPACLDAVFDAMKGVIIVDDNPKYIAEANVKCVVSKLKKSYTVIELERIGHD